MREKGLSQIFILLILVIGLAIGVYLVQNRQILSSKASWEVSRSGDRLPVLDLKKFYPNDDLFKTKYLEGYNYVASGSPTRAVLWFEAQDQWTYRMYNSGPEDVNRRCHWDQLSWWDDGFLRYVKTHHECPGAVANEIVYDPPIIFLPRYWNNNSNWSISNTSSATYLENGVVKCKGVNKYTGTILGWEDVAPGNRAVHWRTTQTTSWTEGRSETSGCAAGYTTRWQEDYWLSLALPINGGGSAYGLKRSKGGNLDVTSATWDIWFDSWYKLPGLPSQ